MVGNITKDFPEDFLLVAIGGYKGLRGSRKAYDRQMFDLQAEYIRCTSNVHSAIRSHESRMRKRAGKAGAVKMDLGV